MATVSRALARRLTSATDRGSVAIDERTVSWSADGLALVQRDGSERPVTDVRVGRSRARGIPPRSARLVVELHAGRGVRNHVQALVPWRFARGLPRDRTDRSAPVVGEAALLDLLAAADRHGLARDLHGNNLLAGDTAFTGALNGAVRSLPVLLVCGPMFGTAAALSAWESAPTLALVAAIAAPILALATNALASVWYTLSTSDAVVTPAVVICLTAALAMLVPRVAWLIAEPALPSILFALHGIELPMVTALAWLGTGRRSRLSAGAVARWLGITIFPLMWVTQVIPALGRVVDVVDPGVHPRRP